ncbi:primosomal protein N' family DNA-binding protein [Luethyella okanaganae]|uniref:Probable replication restart protein PriA n=1 Tax=Luethyella okanaganae TaxID=69372 RepID=A0ABW1VEM5_9MICO
MARTGLVARVLIDTPLPQLDHLFDYRVPSELADEASPGVRVKVPFRSAGRIADGYIVELADDAGFEGALSDIEAIVSTVPVLRPEVWALARRVADRGAGSAIDVVRLAVPPRQVRVERAWVAAQDAAVSADGSARVVSARSSTEITGYSDALLVEAVAAGERLAVKAMPNLVRGADGTWIGQWALTLAQLGSAAVAQGRSAILAVPDFRDQEQLQAALAAVVPVTLVTRFDARQSNPDRYRSFLACLEARPRIVIGNRSALYAPAHDVGLIALWDDGDPLYAEPLSPYAHARDVALVRQEQSGSGLVLLSHSRSAETQRLVEIGWLQEAAPDRMLRPKIVATAQQAANEPLAQAARIPSTAWREARAALEHGPVLVQVAHPGYAPVVACAQCRDAARCARCQGPLGLASAHSAPSCRWCGAIVGDWSCGNCGGRGLRTVTIGAGRTAEDLGRAFPGERIVVADGERPLLTVGDGPALVIATRGAEPIADGGYRAVLLLDGERMLARESLRVGEDCLRWWSNAAALAAQGAPVLLVGVGGALATALGTWRQEAWAANELADRRSLRFPPAVRTASVAGTAEVVGDALGELGEPGGVDVLGPVPAGDGLVRAIVRFDYGAGAEVAGRLRAAIVRVASRRRKSPRGDGYRPAPTLKVRFDDPEIL